MGSRRLTLIVLHLSSIHSHLSEILKHNIVVIVLIVALLVAMLLNRFHLLQSIRSLLLNSSWGSFKEFCLKAFVFST